MYWKQFVDGFELYDDAVFDEEVDPIAGVEPDTVVHHGQRPLMLKSQTILRQFVAQTDGVRAFEQSWAERGVNLHGRADDPLGDVFVTHQDWSSVCSVSSVVRGDMSKQEAVR